ncbi:NnrS family protein [Pseudoxanthomonas suwonensis]|uniref:Short-chain dehydrogenase n=1 Tax=Pseudoxanthomonas suwonensis TaxID=314722 RepID=A0A0E3Z2R9_9GAMM|nr:NnrS family protein [Pseudoxanthomonas suwonensis]AKC86358.1 short-chain dehydrogenase [Pseudoxanthomonas suwonensis]
MHIEVVPPSPARPAAASPRWLAHAPHRLMFFIGAANVLLAMGWWALWLVSARWGLWSMPQLAVPPGWLHAFLMQYLVLPSFVFGFLLTVFPRWMGLPDLERWHYLPVGAGLMGGQLAILLAAAGWEAGLTVGLWMALAGWSAGLAILGRLVADEQGRTWHALSCFAALVLGWLGVAMFLAFVLGAPAQWAFASIKLGGFGLLLPVYATVAHRMFPFFAGNAVPGYRPWRPLGWLAALWALALAHLGLELVHGYAWLWLADAPLLVLTGWAVVRWWPRRNPTGTKMPGLLAVLFVGTLWLPVTFALYLVQSLTYLLGGEFILGRAPMHALFVGFFGSLLVAMVTRVTQGHSGRPLRMYGIAWFAFVAVQVVATVRILADVLPDPGLWQALAAVGWLLALSPWVARIGHIYLTPRRDGRPG